MEEKIIKTIRNLRIQFYLFWLIPIILVILYETGLLPVGIYVDEAHIQFILENIGILLSIIAVPLSLKLFSITLKNKIDNITFPVALYKYELWSGIRLSILELAVIFNIIIYYFTLNNIGGLCALIALTASFFCYPGEKRLCEELHLGSDE